MSEVKIIRSALKSDIGDIQNLLAIYAAEMLLLPRTCEDIEAHLENFTIVEVDGRFSGCVALRDFGNNLYEVRSIAILPQFVNKRLGSALVNYVIAQLKQKPSFRLFALTYRSDFFLRLGFKLVNKDMFPEKIWSDCSVCPKKDNCDEEAVLMENP
jgi:amino-acid N-acetyltransferase